MRHTPPIELMIPLPQTAEGRGELAQQVAEAHATAVIQRIKLLNCPASQKVELLDAVKETFRKRSRERE